MATMGPMPKSGARRSLAGTAHGPSRELPRRSASPGPPPWWT